ncbi:hypothetical protein SAMN05660199_03729 [Klenkia soli]|uniref:Uncharacterized protein n=1 Tax=Klenkia soli TaxID=1052260 RepID=A0A1H0S302_9ACTN|nr:hypothetical protein [Klenkia soli]SDP35995.1 hypothetical protein SAMN05660199_03729 [Klenkia soli]
MEARAETAEYPPPVAGGYPPPVGPASLADRLTPQQLLLGAGVVAVLGTALSAFTVGTPVGVVAVSALLLVAGGLAVLAGHVGSRTAGEALALGAVAAAGTLVAVGAATAPRPALAAGTLAAFVAAAAAALRLVGPELRTWPVASWVALQVTVLVVVRSGAVPAPLLPGVLLGTASLGLAIAWLGEGTGHGPVSRSGLLLSVPWWAAGVWIVERAAWAGEGPVLAAALGVGAGLGLLVTTHHRVPDLPGPPAGVPVLAGLTAGSVLAGAAASSGPDWVLGSGFVGLGLAAVVAVAAARGPEWVPRDAGLTAAVTLTGLAAVGTGRAGRWGDLGLLLVTTAAAAVLLSVRDRDSRPSAAPIAVGAGALAVLALASGGPLPAAGVGAALVAVAVTALAQAVVLAVVLPRRAGDRVRRWVLARVGRADPGVPRGPVTDVRDAFAPVDTGRAAVPVEEPDPVVPLEEPADSPDEKAATSTAGTGTVVGLLGVATAAAAGAWGVTAALLAVLGLALMGHGDVTRGTRLPGVPLDEQEVRGRGTRTLGGLALVAACAVGAAQLGWGAPEVVTVPGGLVLLAGRWRSLAHGPSQRTWGPGLAVALLPSVLLTVLDPTPLRQVLALVAALVLVLTGLGWAVRAPFVLGLVGVLGVTAGWLLDGAPTGWVVVLGVVGAVLVGVGTVRERQRRRGDPVPARLRSLR